MLQWKTWISLHMICKTCSQMNVHLLGRLIFILKSQMGSEEWYGQTEFQKVNSKTDSLTDSLDYIQQHTMLTSIINGVKDTELAPFTIMLVMLSKRNILKELRFLLILQFLASMKPYYLNLKALCLLLYKQNRQKRKLQKSTQTLNLIPNLSRLRNQVKLQLK